MEVKQYHLREIHQGLPNGFHCLWVYLLENEEAKIVDEQLNWRIMAPEDIIPEDQIALEEWKMKPLESALRKAAASYAVVKGIRDMIYDDDRYLDSTEIHRRVLEILLTMQWDKVVLK